MSSKNYTIMRNLFIFLAFILPDFLFAQTIQDVSPDTVHPGQTINIQITGHNTSFTQGSQLIRFFQGSDLLIPYQFNSPNDNQISAWLNIPQNIKPGNYHLSIYNQVDSWMYKYNALTINPWGASLKLSGCFPSWSFPGYSYPNSKITGVNTQFTQASAVAAFLSQGTSTVIHYFQNIIQDDTLLKNVLMVPGSMPYGYYNLNTYDNYHGHLQKADAFLVAKSTGFIAAVSHDTLFTSKPNEILVYGSDTYFKFEEKDISVMLNINNTPYPADSISILNDNILKAYFGSMNIPLGNYNNSRLIINSIISGVMYYNGLVAISTGIDEFSSIKSIRLFQDENNMINLRVDLKQQQQTTVDVFNMHGKIIYTGTLAPGPVQHLKLASLLFKNQVYLFRISCGNDVLTRKLMVIK